MYRKKSQNQSTLFLLFYSNGKTILVINTEILFNKIIKFIKYTIFISIRFFYEIYIFYIKRIIKFIPKIF